MDPKGNIHHLDADTEDALKAQMAELEAQHGKLVPIPEKVLPRVRKMRGRTT